MEACIIKGRRVKTCSYCGTMFSEIDFPQTFGRMVTCGNIECMGRRRVERYKERMRLYVSPDDAQYS